MGAGFGRSGAAEYGRRGISGWVHDHAVATVMTVVLAWIVAVCAIVTSLGSLM